MRFKAKPIFPGKVRGEVLYTDEPITFLGGVDPETGKITESGHELEGKSLRGKILVFPSAKGSTVGSYTIYGLKVHGNSPLAMICSKANPVIAIGAVMAKIPLLEFKDIEKLKKAREVIIQEEWIEIVG